MCDLTMTFAEMNREDQYEILLGRRVNDPTAEDKIDRVVKRFLIKCWNLRSAVTARINAVLGTVYNAWGRAVEKHNNI